MPALFFRGSTQRHSDMPKPDPFRRINALVRTGKHGTALRRMLDLERFRLRGEYRSDANHAWYVIGDLFSTKRRPDLAVAAFRKSVRSRPRDAEALWALGNAYSELARPALAERYLRAALRNARGNAAQIRYNLGNALYDQKKYSAAVAIYKSIRPRDGRAFRLAQRNIQHARARLRR